jgi:hypothetical protein
MPSVDGRENRESSKFFLDLETPGYQEEGINLGFVGGHTALPTILPSPSLGRDEVND